MALFSRITIWVSNQVLTAAALNGEFNNILNNAMASSWIGFSASVGQMQQQANPGGVGTESLAGSISDELQRLRWMFAFVLGTTYWYDQTGRNLGPGGLAITTADLGSKVVTAANIADNTITATQIAPGVLVQIPPYFYQAYWPSSTTNYWSQNVLNNSMLALVPVGTPPAPFGFFNVGFGTPTIATSNHAGINFTAPSSGIIEIEFLMSLSTSISGGTSITIKETTTSTTIAYAAGASAGGTTYYIAASGFLNVTASSTYNIEVWGSCDHGNLNLGGFNDLTGSDKQLSVKMKYVH